ncbi:hypothetical protein PFISCL1PPCAC_26449, partial [Pristionchus fissidentatus]
RPIPMRLAPALPSFRRLLSSPLERSSSSSAPTRNPRSSTRRSRRSRPAFPPTSSEKSTPTRPRSPPRSESLPFTTIRYLNSFNFLLYIRE